MLKKKSARIYPSLPRIKPVTTGTKTTNHALNFTYFKLHFAVISVKYLYIELGTYDSLNYFIICK